MAKFSSDRSESSALERELDGIVIAPYPVSLEKLRGILSGTSLGSLSNWADSNPSLIRPLARSFVEALDLWPRSADVLGRFARVRPVRDAMLLESPDLLQRLLKDAVASRADFDAKSSISVAFLAQPLPDGAALPALAQTFLFMLSNRAYKDPCTATVEPIYDVLCGACSSLPHLLSEGHLATLETHVKHMMRSNEGPEAQLATMLSILILEKIPLRSSPSNDGRHDLFVGENGAKTMNLVTWQVLHACKSDGSLINPEGHVRLARMVAGHIATGTIRTWVEKNPKFADKLWQKLNLPDIAHAVRTETLAFATSILDPPHSCVESFEAIYLVDGDVLHFTQDTFSAFIKAMEHLATFLNDRAWASMLRNLHASVLGVRGFRPQALKNLHELLQVLQVLVATSTSLRSAMLSMVYANETDGNPKSFSGTAHPKSQTCVNIQASYLGLILSATTPTEGGQMSVARSVLSRLLQKQRQLCQMSSPKPVSLQRRTEPDSSSLQQNNKSTRHGTLWNTRVADEVKMHAERCGERVLELFAEAVSDLENRCRDVEEPLRNEQAKLEASESEREQLRSQVFECQNEMLSLTNNGRKFQEANDDLKARITQLESEASFAQKVADELRSENQVLSKKVNNASEELETHVTLVDELERQLAQSSDEAVSSLEFLRNAHNLESIRLSTRIAAQADELATLGCTTETLEQELEVSRKVTNRLHQEAEASASEKTVMTQRNAVLEGEVESLGQELTNARSQLDQVVESLDTLRKDNEEERAKGIAEQHKLFAQRDEETRKMKADLENQLRAAKQEAEAALATATKAEELVESLSTRLEEANHASEQATASHAETIRAKEERIDSLKRKARSLEEERNRSSAQVAKFQANLKQMLGGDIDRTDGPSETTMAQSQALLAESQAAPNIDSSFPESEASSLSPPATAKVPAQKVRPFKVPSRQARSSTHTRRSTRSQAVLGDISPNRRLMLHTPATNKRQSTFSSSTRPASQRRSVRQSFAVTNEQMENAETMCEGLEDEFDDTTCEF